MNREEIIILVKQYLAQSIQGLEMENPKFDFKSKWYDLKSTNDLAEFLKDTSAMVNTFGPDGLIVIGFNDKTKEFISSPFSNSGLKDTSALSDVISRHIDRPFNLAYYEDVFDGNILGILHFPPSIDKPHIIRNYKTERKGNIREEANKIFIRKNSQTFTANRHDLELMIYDRKNIIPEFEVHCSFHKSAFSIDYGAIRREDGPLYAKLVLNIENTGRRPVAICKIEMTLSEYNDPSDHEIHVFKDTGMLKSFPIIIQSSHIHQNVTDIYSDEHYTYEKRKEVFETLQKNMNKLKIQNITLTLTDGHIITNILKITA